MRILVAAIALILTACGGNDQETDQAPAEPQAVESGLTQEQLVKGIGPVRNVSLEGIDEDLAERGEEIFKTNCSACHKMDKRYVGPALGDVLETRTPEYVMNMILNPEEMLKRHPDAKAMLVEFLTPMPNQQLTQEEARAVLEHLREEGSESDEDDDSETEDEEAK